MTELAIRTRRAAFNRALKDADITAIGALLMPDAVLVTGSDSAILSGRKAQMLAWKREFAAAIRTVYVRVPDRIEASTIEPIAFEYGAWKQLGSSEEVVAHGTYVAKWRQLRGDWMIEAEVFLTLG
jgi:ketosteroid isomerase-like protein